MTDGSIGSAAAGPPAEGNAPSAPTPTSRQTRPRVLDAIAALGLAALILAAGAVVPPIHETSTTSISAEVRHETVVAALERGLAPLHPLILDASVEPGPASAPAELGQRATVTFVMLGVPGPTRVKLFVDVGAHWGGTPDRGAAELAIWSLLTPVLVLGGPWLLWRVRRRRADRRPTA
jgi:hypothetical protein